MSIRLYESGTDGMDVVGGRSNESLEVVPLNKRRTRRAGSFSFWHHSAIYLIDDFSSTQWHHTDRSTIKEVASEDDVQSLIFFRTVDSSVWMTL